LCGLQGAERRHVSSPWYSLRRGAPSSLQAGWLAGQRERARDRDEPVVSPSASWTDGCVKQRSGTGIRGELSSFTQHSTAQHRRGGVWRCQELPLIPVRLSKVRSGRAQAGVVAGADLMLYDSACNRKVPTCCAAGQDKPNWCSALARSLARDNGAGTRCDRFRRRLRTSAVANHPNGSAALSKFSPYGDPAVCEADPHSPQSTLKANNVRVQGSRLCRGSP